MGKRTGTIAALIGLVVVLASAAQARRQMPDVTGSYFGSFITSNNNFYQTDLNITNQAGARVGGLMNVGGVLNGVLFSGVVRPDGRISLTGVAGNRPNLVRVKMHCQHGPGSETDNATIVGRFFTTGALRMRGTFTLVGRSRMR